MFTPETGRDDAIQVAQRLCRLVAESAIDLGATSVRLTLSVGVSTMAPGLSVDDCVQRADLALYQAKTEGRDRVVFAG